jgi:hypothetical protein
MASCEMLRRTTFERTDVWEERVASIIRVTGIGELGTILAVITNQITLRKMQCKLYTIILCSALRLLFASCFPSSPNLVTMMMEALRPPKHRLLQEPHGATSQKTPFFFFFRLCVQQRTREMWRSSGGCGETLFALLRDTRCCKPTKMTRLHWGTSTGQ